jgi:hypothetical protein
MLLTVTPRTLLLTVINSAPCPTNTPETAYAALSETVSTRFNSPPPYRIHSSPLPRSVRSSTNRSKHRTNQHLGPPAQRLDSPPPHHAHHTTTHHTTIGRRPRTKLKGPPPYSSCQSVRLTSLPLSCSNSLF